MDESLKTLLLQLPAVAVLLWWVNRWIDRLYTDFKADRVQSSIERATLLNKLDALANQWERVEIALARVERACGADMLPPAPKP